MEEMRVCIVIFLKKFMECTGNTHVISEFNPD